MTRSRASIAITFALLIAPDPAWAQAPDLTQKLDEARALLREARFDEVIQRLQAVVGALERQRDLKMRRGEVADACLELGFSHLRLGEREAAREAFQSALMLQRTRRLDPQLYVASVVALFEEARAVVERSPGRRQP